MSLDCQKPPTLSTWTAQLRGSHFNDCAAVWWPKGSTTTHPAGSFSGSVLSSRPGQRSLFDSGRPVDGQIRSPLASGTPLPTSQIDRGPDHGRGAPAGAARPALCVGGTHPPPPPPPPLATTAESPTGTTHTRTAAHQVAAVPMTCAVADTDASASDKLHAFAACSTLLCNLALSCSLS